MLKISSALAELYVEAFRDSGWYLYSSISIQLCSCTALEALQQHRLQRVRTTINSILWSISDRLRCKCTRTAYTRPMGDARHRVLARRSFSPAFSMCAIWLLALVVLDADPAATCRRKIRDVRGSSGGVHRQLEQRGKTTRHPWEFLLRCLLYDTCFPKNADLV